MMARVIAWVIVAAVLWGIAHGLGAWKNPWSSGGAVVPAAAVVVNPVLSNLPAASNGCGEKCRE